MLLAIDIGNTNITLGAFTDDELSAFWRLATVRDRMADEYMVILNGLLDAEGWHRQQVEAAVIASVVPPVLDEWLCVLDHLHIDTRVLKGGPDFKLDVRYNPPSSVGADRLANAIATDAKYGRPAIIVDLGTATTIDVLGPQGDYIGGAIAPGMQTSMEALVGKAFQLPKLDLAAPQSAIATNTVDSIRSGTLFGYAGLVDSLVDRFITELGTTPHIIATGGLAPLVAPHTKHLKIIDAGLTLDGLRIAYQRGFA